MALITNRFFLLTAGALSLGAVIAAGCGDSDDTGSGGSTTAASTTAAGMGGSTAQGMGGMTGMCAPDNACERCAANNCAAQALACCEATGCEPLLYCAAEFCRDCSDADQVNCALASCPDEAVAGAASQDEVQALADCIRQPLEDATDPDCAACAEEFGGTGGGGGMAPVCNM